LTFHLNCDYNKLSVEKAKPVVRRGRKATGLY